MYLLIQYENGEITKHFCVCGRDLTAHIMGDRRQAQDNNLSRDCTSHSDQTRPKGVE